MNPNASLTPVRAVVLYLIYVAVFVIGGGIGAGVPAWLFELVTGEEVTSSGYFTLYAIMFGVTGYIAYKLAQRVAED